MKDAIADSQKDEKVKDGPPFKKQVGLWEEDHLLNPLHPLHFNVMPYRISNHRHCSFGLLDEQIPRSLVSVDDKYIQECLQSIHLSASLSSLRVSILSDHLNSAEAGLGQAYDATWGNHKHESDFANETIVSSSTSFYPNSPQSSSNSASLCRGMLQCGWKERTPHFVFSSNDLKEIYTAKLWKVNSDSKASDYIYLFQSGMNSQNDDDSVVDESRLAGKMTVSTSSSLCPNNSKVVETEFVLYGGIGTSETEKNISDNNLRRRNGLSGKVVDVFRANHLSKQRSVSGFTRQVPGQDYCLWEPYTRENERFHLLQNDLPPNFQLAAIVVKEHLPEKHHDDNGGGWGLKFLKKVEKKRSSQSPEDSEPSECWARNGGGCSTGTDVLIPARLHGGPRTRKGGLSTLIERWRSGGGCDCGGWDLGCPLTTFKVRSSEEKLLPRVDIDREVLVQGWDHGLPALRMVNIRDDLYFIHFRRNVSALQCFSMAVAIIHSRSTRM